MSSRLQAAVTIAVGCLIALIGAWWAISVVCCSGKPRESAIAFAAVGLGLAGLGIWAFRGGDEPRSVLRRNSLWATLVILAAGTAALAHAVLGVHREQTFPMRWEESSAYFANAGGIPAGAPTFVVLSFESRPDYFLRVDDERLAGFLLSSTKHEVDATFDLTFAFGEMKTLRLMRVGEKTSPVGFEVTSGVRGEDPGKPPWD